MSQNVQNKNIYNEERNKEINKSENIDKQNKAIKRKGTDYGVKKIINNAQRNNKFYQTPSNQNESDLDASKELQFFNGVLQLMKSKKKNIANNLDENNSNIFNMSTQQREIKISEPNTKKENTDEGNNNGDDKFIEKNSYINYQNNKNDEQNNAKENNDYHNVEKDVFNNQYSINQQDIEDNINNELSHNLSSILIKEKNECNSESNKINFISNEINKSDKSDNKENNESKVRKYDLPISSNKSIINSINYDPFSSEATVFTQEEKNNSNNKEINKSFFTNIQSKDGPNNISKISQDSESEEKIFYSQPNFSFNFPTDITEINNDSNVPSNLENDKDDISHNEKNDIKIDNNINSGNSGNPNNQKVSKHILDRYKRVSKTGLINLGDTSYINAVLQSLGHVRYFASYFLNPKNQKLIESNLISMPLSYATYRLFTHLYPYPEKNTIEIYSPKSYLEILSYLKSPYGIQRSNPNDLLIFILNTLHNELNINKSNNSLNIMSCDNFSVESVIQNGISNFTKNNKSKISDVICWFQMNETICSNCWKSTFRLDYFNTYDLDIKNTYEYYLKNGKNNINLYDCLFYGSIPKSGNSYCYNCKNTTNYFRQSRIYSPPNVFIFLLDRGIDFSQNIIHIPFKVEEKIDLSDFVIKKNTPVHYGLTGIVSFNLKEQKYVSYCQSPIDSNWYLYNDEKVNLVFFEDIVNNKNDNDNDIPCILYYKPI